MEHYLKNLQDSLKAINERSNKNFIGQDLFVIGLCEGMITTVEHIMSNKEN